MNEQEELDAILPPGLMNLLRTCPLPDYQPPVEKVCGYCGKKHTGPFQACSSCKSALDRGE